MCIISACVKFLLGADVEECSLLVILQGQRALDFVLRNQGLIDKTLLFDIELIRVVQN